MVGEDAFFSLRRLQFWEQYKAAVSKMILNDKKIIEENDVLGDAEKESYFNQYNATEKMIFGSLPRGVSIIAHISMSGGAPAASRISEAARTSSGDSHLANTTPFT